MWNCMRGLLLGFVAALVTAPLLAVPVPAGGPATITDRKDFIPNRKHLPLPGKIVAVLAFGAQPVLSLEGRSGPPDQLCVGYNGGSYRWVYVPVKENPFIGSLNIAVGDKGEKRKFDRLSLANPVTVKQWDVAGKYALVEIEVNGGLGSPATDSFVATKMRKLDGTADFPLKVEEIIAELQSKYDLHIKDQARQLDTAMEKAGADLLKDKKATGPRERTNVVFVTWLPEAERLRVHFRSTMVDGDYKYANGVKIEVGQPGPGAPAPLVPNGLRYGTQFGIEFGAAFEVSKSGKVERMLTLPPASFQRELPMPPAFRPRGVPNVRP